LTETRSPSRLHERDAGDGEVGPLGRSQRDREIAGIVVAVERPDQLRSLGEDLRPLDACSLVVAARASLHPQNSARPPW
jgi:hypothetical protein